MLESGLSDARRLSCRARTSGARTTIAAAAHGAAAFKAGSAPRSGALPAQAGDETRTAHAAAMHASALLHRKVIRSFSTVSHRVAIWEAAEQGFGQLPLRDKER